MTDVTTNVEPQDAEESPVRNALRRLLEGDLGSLRVIVVLAIIWTIFAIANDRFLTAINLTNLSLQIAAVGTISIGVVLVLLLGEIDLSVGAVSGLAAACVATLNVKHGWNPYLAMAAGIGVGAADRHVPGHGRDTPGDPDVRRHAGRLAGLAGRAPRGPGQHRHDQHQRPGDHEHRQRLPRGLAVLGAGDRVHRAARARRARRAAQARRRRPGAGAGRRRAWRGSALRRWRSSSRVAVVNSDRGVPLALVILVGLVLAVHLLLTRTTFGRHVYAVGGNAEAARRAGISVVRVRTIVFAMASMFAAFGGIVAMSRLLAVNQGSGGSDLLLLAIAGPVIAGVSLFGGRGNVWAALLGALVIGSISNGMDLLAFESSTKYMVTGGVLLGAVSLDAIGSKRRQQTRR